MCPEGLQGGTAAIPSAPAPHSLAGTRSGCPGRGEGHRNKVRLSWARRRPQKQGQVVLGEEKATETRSGCPGRGEGHRNKVRLSWARRRPQKHVSHVLTGAVS